MSAPIRVPESYRHSPELHAEVRRYSTPAMLLETATNRRAAIEKVTAEYEANKERSHQLLQDWVKDGSGAPIPTSVGTLTERNDQLVGLLLRMVYDLSAATGETPPCPVCGQGK